MTSTMVSVIMPAYNAESYIEDAIQSILCQSYTNFELIVVDDASIDQTSSIVQRLDDHRIHYHRNDHNMGVAATLNVAVEMANGQYLARMDADDIASSERLRIQVEYLDNHPDVGVCGTGVFLYDGIRDYKTRLFSSSTYQIAVDLLFGSALAHPTVMMRRTLFTNLGVKYDADYYGCEDYRLWTQLITNTAFHNISEPLLHYRKHNNQITANPSDRNRLLIRKIRADYCEFIGRKLNSNEEDLLDLISKGQRTFSDEEKQQVYTLFLDLIPALSALCGHRSQVKEMLSQIFFSFQDTRIIDYRRLSTCRTIAHRVITR